MIKQYLKREMIWRQNVLLKHKVMLISHKVIKRARQETNRQQGSTLRKNFISPAGLVTETFTSPEIFLLALILRTTLLKQ